MNRTTKIILGIAGAVLVFCGLLCVATLLLLPRAMQNFVSGTTTNGHEVGQQIADYVLPSGYKEEMGMDLVVEKIVMIAPERGEGPAITLFQVNSPYTSREELEQQMRQSFQQAFKGQGTGMHDVGEHQVTLKGAPSTLTVSESSSGPVQMRQATGVFKGKGGIALIMIMGNADTWDWSLVDQFCQSIR